MRFIKKLLGSDKGQPGESKFGESRFDESAFADDARSAVASLGTRRELLQMLVRDAMRKHGIPSAWLNFFVLLVPPGLHLLLTVRQEPERVFAVAGKFQRDFMAELGRFDPQSAQWLHGLSWQFAAFDVEPVAAAAQPVTGALPATSPEPATQTPSVPVPSRAAPVALAVTAAPAVPAAPSRAQAKADLEREFATADAKRRSARRQPEPQPDFEQTAFDSGHGDFSDDEFRPTEPAKL